MSLTLKVLLFNGQPYVEGKDIIFKETGGTIGRSDACSLILADEKKMISRCHATIEFTNGQYQLIDNSLAGTFINDDPTPISNANVQLVDGMHITIGDYTIACCINDEMSSISPTTSIDSTVNQTDDVLDVIKPDRGNPFAEEYSQYQANNNAILKNTENNESSPFPVKEQKDNSVDNLLNEPANDLLLDSQFSDNSETISVSNNSLLDFGANKRDLKDHALIDENVSSLNDSFIPAGVKQDALSESAEMPADFDFFEDFFIKEEQNTEQTDGSQVTTGEPLGKINSSGTQTQSGAENTQFESLDSQENVIKQNGEVENAQLLQAFINGARVNDKDIDFKNPVEKMERIGLMFRQFVDQTVAILRNRAEFKSLFRVSVTTIKSSDNNPLKFAVTTDEAIKHLINDGQVGFKQSIDSIDEGFSDILNHQMAMQAGIQASLIDILRQFDPAVIEKQYQEGFVFNKKSKCWDKYIKIHNRLSETVVDDFFGDAFSDAYEKQMKKLKN